MDHHYAVTIAGLPKMFVKASSPVEVKTKLRKMLKRPTEDIIDVERVTDADVRKHFRDMLKPDVQNEETYSPQKHEWGTDAAALWAKEMTPGEEKKKEKTVTVEEGKSFFEIRESMKSADKKPQTYRDPETGKMITRMVHVDKEAGIVAKKEAKTYDSGWKKTKKDDKKVSPMDRVKQLAQKGMKQAEKK